MKATNASAKAKAKATDQRPPRPSWRAPYRDTAGVPATIARFGGRWTYATTPREGASEPPASARTP